MPDHEQSAKEQPAEKEKGPVLPTATIFILAGIALIILDIYLKDKVECWDFGEVLVEFMSHIGIGLLVIGLLGILIDSKHWSEYFEKRLSAIVIGKKYLKELKRENLVDLQTEVLKAYFDNDSIGGTDGFLHYYQRNIQVLISSPFRKDVNFVLHVAYADASTKDNLKISETISWCCNSNGGSIQKDVSYSPDPKEFEKIINFQVKLLHEKYITKDNPAGEILFDMEKLKEEKYMNKDNMGFNLPLTEYNHDKLRIELSADYITRKARFLAWRMAYPTRNVMCTIIFPEDLSVERELYLGDSTPISEKTEIKGYYNLQINDWLMPNDGITFQLL